VMLLSAMMSWTKRFSQSLKKISIDFHCFRNKSHQLFFFSIFFCFFFKIKSKIKFLQISKYKIIVQLM